MKICMERRGFTVVELGALVAVGGSFGVAMVPVGGHLQKANLDTQSQWVHHDLARRQFTYMGDHQGEFTGPNTSGAAWNRQPLGGFPNPGIETLEFDTAPGNPTSQGDWITPLVGDALGFSANRARRTQQKFEMVLDPTTDRMVDFVYSSSFPDDYDEFGVILSSEGYRQRSFIQPSGFSLFSAEHDPYELVVDIDNGFFYRIIHGVQHPGDPALSPEGYTPNIANVGTQLSNKVMFADGTRYLGHDGMLDFNIDLFQGPHFFDDLDFGPIVHSSTAYGRGHLGSKDDGNLDLSFRKQGGNGMYATMFDGSLHYLTREEAWTDPTPWYPSGSVWQGLNSTVESQAWVDKNLPDGIIH